MKWASVLGAAPFLASEGLEELTLQGFTYTKYVTINCDLQFYTIPSLANYLFNLIRLYSSYLGSFRLSSPPLIE